MGQSCAAFTDHSGNPLPLNTDAELDDLKSAIQQVSGETGVDDRFILAVVLQESSGCVRAPTTNGGVRNPGLIQDHDGTGTCNSDVAPYGVQSPCPQDQIRQMIHDGSE